MFSAVTPMWHWLKASQSPSTIMVSSIFQSPMRWPSRERGRTCARLAHALLAAGDHDVGVAAGDRLHRQMHRLEPAAADLVDGHGRDPVGQPGVEGGLAGRVLADASGQHLTQDDLVDLVGRNPGARQQRLEHDGAEFGRRQGWQGCRRRCRPRYGRRDDDDVLAHGVDVLWL